MNLGDLKFLVVEDHDFQRGVVLRMMARLGATRVLSARDGRSALRLIETSAEPIDVIISDLDMPGMDGMEFMRHLGEAKVPASIILCSGLDGSLLSSVETMTMAYGVRILGVLEKPIRPSTLTALLERRDPGAPAPRPAGPPGPAFTIAEVEAGLQQDQFEPFFQPKVDLATGAVKGAEALARWRHPAHGIVPPNGFIGLLEDLGQIDALTWVMLRKSAIFCREWREASGAEVTVSVNLSVKSLGDASLADRVTRMVRDEGLEPRCMVLEVTESATTTEVGQTLENLSRLRMKGFGLSIDDFGTGYSSLQQLTRIPFTELKIDQSFVANASRQPSARIILESSIDMARRLKIVAVAEGVETQRDWELVRELGYQLAQGYLVSRPLEGGAFLSWAGQRAGAAAAAGPQFERLLSK